MSLKGIMLCPFGDNAARIMLEFAAAEVDIDDLAPIEIR